MKVLLQEDFITLKYDAENHWLLAEWKGYQTVESVKAGCEKMLEYLISYKANKVLNDNTLVTGIWSCASAWVGNDWFPRMSAAGLEKFAWVYSKSVFSRLSTDESLKNMVDNSIAKTFTNYADAGRWLN
ncbi:MAG: hypothetical protein M3512_01560 [Bacteroidota bacterium]|nr:hypothetical protein [Bacteroidota bacterium]